MLDYLLFITFYRRYLIMNIGIAYDTASMYDIRTDGTYYDFAEQASINNLKHIIEGLRYGEAPSQIEAMLIY